MEDSSRPPLPSALGAARVRWPLVVLLLVIGAGLGIAGGKALPAQTTATATVLVEDPAAFNNLTPAQQPTDTSVYVARQQQIVTAPDTLAEAARRLQASDGASWTAEVVRSHVTVDSSDIDGLLAVNFEATTAGTAQRGADAVVRAFVAESSSDAATAARNEIRRVNRALAALPAAGDDAVDQAALDSTRTALLQRRANAQLAEASPGAGVVQTSLALPPAAPARAVPTWLAGLGGAIGGFLIGVALTYLFALARPTLMDARRAQIALGLPLLGSINRRGGRIRLSDRRDLEALALVLATRAARNSSIVVIASPSLRLAQEVASALASASDGERKVGILHGDVGSRSPSSADWGTSIALGGTLTQSTVAAFDLVIAAIDVVGPKLGDVENTSVILALRDHLSLDSAVSYVDRLSYMGLTPEAWIQVRHNPGRRETRADYGSGVESAAGIHPATPRASVRAASQDR